jgi:hypothetical protein
MGHRVWLRERRSRSSAFEGLPREALAVGSQPVSAREVVETPVTSSRCTTTTAPNLAQMTLGSLYSLILGHTERDTWSTSHNLREIGRCDTQSRTRETIKAVQRTRKHSPHSPAWLTEDRKSGRRSLWLDARATTLLACTMQFVPQSSPCCSPGV